MFKTWRLQTHSQTQRAARVRRVTRTQLSTPWLSAIGSPRKRTRVQVGTVHVHRHALVRVVVVHVCLRMRMLARLLIIVRRRIRSLLEHLSVVRGLARGVASLRCMSRF